MPDKLPSTVRTGSVQVKFADGSERTLPIHGITQLQLIRLCDDLGIKSFEELKAKEPTLVMIRFMTHTVAEALTFEKMQDVWSMERIEKSFADMEEICKAWLKCLDLSPLPRASKDEGRKGRPIPRQTPYH